MDRSKNYLNVSAMIILLLCLIFGSTGIEVARADTTPLTLPFNWDWSETAALNTPYDWGGLQGIMGYQGTGLGNKITGIDPQTILADGTNTSISLNPNQLDPNSLSSAGVAEFELEDPSIGLSGSNAPHAPFLLINLSTLGRTDIVVGYDVRDLESSKQDAVQQVALHYRIGNSGLFTNVPQAYVADATDPYTATKVTHISVALPETVDNQPLVQLRIMTANAVGKDEWVGIDNIAIGSDYMPDDAPSVSAVTPAPDESGVLADSSISVTFSEAVTLTDGWFSLDCTLTGSHAVSVSNTDSLTYLIDTVENFARSESCQARVTSLHVSDLDGLPPAEPGADFTWSFTTADTPASPTIEILGWDPQLNSGKTVNFILTLQNPASSPSIPHSRIRFLFSNVHPEAFTQFSVFDPDADAWIDFPLVESDENTETWLGPEEGFFVSDSYSSSKLVRLRFATPGHYVLTIQWDDLDAGPSEILTQLIETADVETSIFLPIIFR